MTETSTEAAADADRLDELREHAAECQACELYRDATQTVFGAGPRTARLVLVGEQPGDVEDRSGEPFVGPAGRVLDDALETAGIERRQVYVTNAVKHFRWRPAPRGKRRIHQAPGTTHIRACQPWLAAELRLIEPTGVVALGATAARALLGSAFRLTERRGQVIGWPPERGPFADSTNPVEWVVATYHPSAVLRADGEDRERVVQALVGDLRVAAAGLSGSAPG